MEYFSSIVGNRALKDLIGPHIEKKTHTHAYIIEGPAGSGKKTFAKEMCKAFYCLSGDRELPCGHCKNCQRTDSGYNTDIFVLNKGDKATIPVEAVRDMTATLGYYPDDGDVKIYIIEEAEKLTVQAQNALLLSLEEPPSYVVFILLTEDSTALLETVRSRAQILKTEVFPSVLVADWLRQRPECKNKSDDAVATAAAVSRGSLGSALTALSEKNSKSAAIASDALKLLELMCIGSQSEAIVFAAGIKYSRAEFEQFFDCAIFALRDLLCAKYSDDHYTYYADKETPAKLSGRLNLAKLTGIYDALVKAKDDITKKNAQIYAVMTTLAAGTSCSKS